MKYSALCASLLFVACGQAVDNDTLFTPEVETADLDADAAWQEAITDVEHTPVKRQSIGNCWLYATATWAESMHLTVSGETTDLSETYWTYWHWFDQITRSGVKAIRTGGSYETAREIIRNYGIMYEADFIAEEEGTEISWRQADALAAMNVSLSTGALSTPEARRDRSLVRRELDAAFRLKPEVSEEIVKVFGETVSRNMRSASIKTDGTRIVKPSLYATLRARPTSTPMAPTTQVVSLTSSLSDWNTSSYPYWSTTSQRSYLARIQRALHDKQPLIVTWFVDFNSLDSEGRFFAPPETPGRQGGHMVVAEDYQVNNVPGYGTLAAGELVTDTAALRAALSSSAEIEFIRVKNSWGNARSTVVGYPGHHDLYMAYLNGPVMRCNTNADGTTNTSDCPYETTPFYNVVFPSGY